MRILRQRTQVQRCAALQLTPSTLRLLAFDGAWDEAAGGVARSLPWRHEATSLHSERGRAELTAAFKQLAHQYKLQGQPISLALDSAFCVTRVLRGTAARVRQELNQIEERTALYLSLGPGRKAAISSLRHLDARNQEALVTVVNERTLDTILESAARAGIEFSHMESSMLSLCRLVGYTRGDQDEPALLVDLGEQDVRLGVSYRGRLMLDYRPAGRKTADDVAPFVQSHVGRLRRFCERRFGFTERSLNQAFVCGESDAVSIVHGGLLQNGSVQPAILQPPAAGDVWASYSDISAAAWCAVAGACLRHSDVSDQAASPNLLELWRSRERGALLPALAKTFWPAAAAVLLAVGLWSGAFYQRSQNHLLAIQLAMLGSQQQLATELRTSIMADQQRTEHLARVAAGTRGPSWHDVADSISRCLPPEAWLDNVNLDGNRRLSLSGTSLSENGVFDFVEWLRRNPSLRRVAVSGTRAASVAASPALQFEVMCDLADRSDQEVKADEIN